MPFPDNVSLFIHFVSLCGDDFAWHRDVAVRETYAVKLNLQITLSHKMARLFIGFQVPTQITAAGKHRLAELP